MFKLDLLKNIRQKGAMFVEYALILAFVIAVGVIFLGEGGFKDSIASIFGQTSETLAVAVNGGEKYRGDFKEHVNKIKNNEYTSNSSGKGWAYSNVLNSVNNEQKQQFVWIPDNPIKTEDGKVYAMSYLTWVNNQSDAQYAVVLVDVDSKGNILYNPDNTVSFERKDYYTINYGGESVQYKNLLDKYESYR